MLSIGKFAEIGDVGVETIRFYQRRGLLSIPNRHGGIRRYGEADLRQLRFIRKAQTAGFTLEEIRELVALNDTQDKQRARDLAMSRLETLEVEMKELRKARDALKRLAAECCSGKSGPCPILKSFRV